MEKGYKDEKSNELKMACEDQNDEGILRNYGKIIHEHIYIFACDFPTISSINFLSLK